MRDPDTFQVLERDLAIFGFFIALGRRTQSFIDANNIDMLDESFASFLRFLVGGSVLFYPQLASVSTYQLYVEVVCEEMDWLPFYPDRSSKTGKQVLENRRDQFQTATKMEAMTLALDVCCHWVQSFIKYSVWLEKPSNIKAARFLSTSHSKLDECRKALYISATIAGSKDAVGKDMVDGKDSNLISGEQTLSNMCIPIEEINLFDKELQSVEEALTRLEGLLKELHVSSSSSGKEHLAAACTDLERIRKLKKEAEFLEASLRAKAASGHQADESFEQTSSSVLEEAATVSNEIQRFELLRHELVELEKRVQESADGSSNEKGNHQDENQSLSSPSTISANDKLAKVGKKDSMFSKSIGKLKDAGSVTAVGHAAMLAAIKRYFPALIPSAYARERLDLLRQLEKVQEMELTVANSDEERVEMPSVQINDVGEEP